MNVITVQSTLSNQIIKQKMSLCVNNKKILFKYKMFIISILYTMCKIILIILFMHFGDIRFLTLL